MTAFSNKCYYILKIRGQAGSNDRIQVRNAVFDLVAQYQNGRLVHGKPVSQPASILARAAEMPFGKMEKIDL